MSRRADLAALALIALTIVRIASTWTVFSATVDEPMHISAGLQLYTQHTYTYQPENPPLPRLVLAFAPWLGGMVFDPNRTINDQLLGVFYSNGKYKTNLVLARAGNLVFFVIASLATWLWARRELGSRGGLLAAFFFVLQPMIAGHSGLATLDMAGTAGFAVSLLAFIRWLERPSPPRAVALGAAYGLAVLCKFSCIGYIPAACLAVYLVRVIRDRETRAAWKSVLSAAPIALVTAMLTVWIGYAFHPEVFFAGIRGLAAIDRAGYFGYLFGDVRTTGWWWYFPAAVALKSTIASLILALSAIAAPRFRAGAEALAAAGAIFLVAMPSHLNLGVRYVLPIYVPIAIAAAAGALVWLERRRWIVVALLVWHAGASLLAHPDAFPYFNEAAGRRPWLYLIDSNIDWGQDALRLKRAVRERKIDRLGIAVLGWHDWDKLGFPPHHDLSRDVPSQGWVAVSEHLFGVVRGAPWLEGRRYERIGKSIRLYYIE